MSFIVALAALVTADAQPAASEAIQAAAEEFQLIAAAHRDLRAYDLRIDIAVSSTDSSVPLHAVVKCDGRQRCLRLFRNSTTLETPGLSLMVDSNERIITVTRHKLDAAGAPSVDPASALQTWIEKGGRLSGGELTETGRHWAFDSSKPGLPTGEMYVDPRSRLLRRLVYRTETAAGARTTIDIRYDWEDATQLDPAEFETSRFVQERGGAIVPVQEYAQYRIINSDRQ